MRKLPPLLLLLLFCFGCSSPVRQQDEYLNSYYYGNISQAEVRLTETINKSVQKGGVLKSKDAVWLLLDRATTRFAMGKIDGAIHDYKVAIDTIKYFNQDSTLESVDPLLARVYFALVLLHQGDLSNAYALLRQAEEVQQKKKALYPKISSGEHYRLIDNPIAKYLFAALLEHNGDISNARILYQQAGKMLGLNYVENDLQRLESEKNPKATVFIVYHNAKAPIKISRTVDTSAASADGSEFFLAIDDIVDRRDPALGFTADFAMLIANANTHADNRSWTTLPSSIDMSRYELSSGTHKLQIQISPDKSNPIIKKYELDLRSGDFCVINVFNISLGVTTIQVPNRFLNKKENSYEA